MAKKKEIKTAKDIAAERRAHPRNKPKDYDYMTMQVMPDEKDYMAMIIDESAGGCSAVIRTVHLALNQLEKGSVWYVRLGKKQMRRAEIRWVSKLNEQLINCGFQFLD